MLDSCNLCYAPFHDIRTNNKPGFCEGESGPLMLATDPRGKKYIVKHIYSHNAANEYVASWLASQVGVLAPHVELLTPNKKFDSHYAVAIEYFDDFTSPIETSPFYKADIISLFALNTLIAQTDRIQYRQHGNRVIPFDFSECFNISHDIMRQLLELSKSDDDVFYRLARDTLRQFGQFLSCARFELPDTAEMLHFDSSEMTSGMISVAKRVLNISDAAIDAMVDELCNLYPCNVAMYYDLCIHAMQDRMKSFT